MVNDEKCLSLNVKLLAERKRRNVISSLVNPYHLLYEVCYQINR